MEWKVGEINDVRGVWYQCVETKEINCGKCDGRNIICQRDTSNYPFEGCLGYYRTGTDKKTNIIFRKLKKVGEPYKFGDKLMQKYNIYAKPYISDFRYTYIIGFEVGVISIEVKESSIKESMFERRVLLKQEDIDYVVDIIRHVILPRTSTYDSIIKEIKQLFSPIPTEENNSKSDLKPFDIEEAKQGKPVCTRDGRKATVWKQTLENKNFPIVAIVSCGQEENVYQYDINGVCDEHDENLDLMMFSQKKEGWINVSMFEKIYPTKKDAELAAEKDTRVTTKIEWNEK